VRDFGDNRQDGDLVAGDEWFRRNGHGTAKPFTTGLHTHINFRGGNRKHAC